MSDDLFDNSFHGIDGEVGVVDGDYIDNGAEFVDMESEGFDLRRMSVHDYKSVEVDDGSDDSIDECVGKLMAFFGKRSDFLSRVSFDDVFNVEYFDSEVSASLSGYYESDVNFNVFCNALLKGYVVGRGFDHVSSNKDKIYLLGEEDMDSVHLRDYVRGGVKFSFFKNYPALVEFSEESVDSLSSLFVNSYVGYNSLYSMIKDKCYTPVVRGCDDRSYVHAFDNLSLVNKMMKSKRSYSSCVSYLRNLGFSDERLNKISVLYKSVRDNME